MGVLEDVSIKVRDLYTPVDFVMLEIEEDTHTPIILRRPFLAIVGHRIDVKNGRSNFDMGVIMWSLTCLKLLNFLLFFMNAIELM